MNNRQKKAESHKNADAAILQSIYTSFVAQGLIDPRGKSDAELKKEFRLLARKFAKQKTIYGVIVHHGGLLKEARAYAKKEKDEMACLFYATWFEHWINFVINCTKTGLSSDEIKLLIRDCSIKAKYTCLPTLLGLPPLANKHINAAFRIAELRNAFVHYKFTPSDVEDWGKKKISGSTILSVQRRL